MHCLKTTGLPIPTPEAKKLIQLPFSSRNFVSLLYSRDKNIGYESN